MQVISPTKLDLGTSPTRPSPLGLKHVLDPHEVPIPCFLVTAQPEIPARSPAFSSRRITIDPRMHQTLKLVAVEVKGPEALQASPKNFPKVSRWPPFLRFSLPVVLDVLLSLRVTCYFYGKSKSYHSCSRRGVSR